MIKLSLKNKSYKKDVIIEHMNLEIHDGEFLIIKGKSGSGKSTLVNILSLLDNDYKGILEIDGHNLSDCGPRKQADFRRENFGLIFQDYNLLPKLTVKENIIFSLDVIGYKGNKSVRADEILELVGLDGHSHKKINEISGGQQQRIGIARSLAADPKYIIADEPTGNLDAETAKEILELLQTLNHQGRTVIMISHDENLIQYSSRVITIANGEIKSNEVIKEVDEISYIPTDKFKFSVSTMFRQAGKNFKRHIWKYIVLIIITLTCSITFAFTQVMSDQVQDRVDRIELVENQTSYSIYKDNKSGENDSTFSKEEVNSIRNNPLFSSISTGKQYLDILEINGVYPKVEAPYGEINGVENWQIGPYTEKKIYLISGEKSTDFNKIIVDESFIKLFIDDTYDIKNGDSSKYVGQTFKITYGMLKEPQNWSEKKEDYYNKEYEFIISGIDNSSSKQIFGRLYSTAEQNDYYLNDFAKTFPELGILDIVNNIDAIGLTENNEEILKVLDGYNVYSENGERQDEQKATYNMYITVATLVGIITTSIILGIINLKTTNQREKELGIYYALGLSKIRITSILFFEATISLLISIVLIFASMYTLNYLVYDVFEFMIIPEVLYKNTNYFSLLGFMIAITLLSLSFVTIKILKQDPIKILRKV